MAPDRRGSPRQLNVHSEQGMIEEGCLRSPPRRRTALSLHVAGPDFLHAHAYNLAFLRNQAERLDRGPRGGWPATNRRERTTSEKLKDADVKTRYSKH